MTSVFYSRTEDGHELMISGHAGYDSEGRDIVCSAVSAIAYALLGFLENEANDASDYAYMTESGLLGVTAAASDRVDVAFDMALIGLMQIAKNYPDYVRVSIFPQEADDLGEKALYDLGERP